MEVLQAAVAGVEAALQHVTRLVAVLVRQPVVRAAAVTVHCNTNTAARGTNQKLFEKKLCLWMIQQYANNYEANST